MATSSIGKDNFDQILKRGFEIDAQNISVKALMDSIVPISRFQQGDVKEIFNEVQASGTKVVLQDNEPTCVLIDPNKYEMMVEAQSMMQQALEDYALYFEAEQRAKDKNCKTYTRDEICSHFGITEEDLANVEVEIE